MESNKTKKLLINKFLIFNIAAMVLIFCSMFFIILPSTDKLTSINATVQADQGETENKKSLIKQSDNLNIGIKDVETKLNEFTSGFISKADEVDFIYTLENLGNKLNLKNNLSIGEKKPIATFQQSDIQIVLQGKYIDEVAYLSEIKKLKYQITVNSVNFTQGGASGSDSVNMTVFATVFWQ
ncbi:MAG: hypothetical protein WCG01_02930 [bacterium]